MQITQSTESEPNPEFQHVLRGVQMWLAEVGLYYYKNRIYAPGIGRLLQADPIGYVAGMNLYVYASNDPVNNVDPLGLDTITVWGTRCIDNCGSKAFGAAREAGGIGGGGGGLGRGEGVTAVPVKPEDVIKIIGKLIHVNWGIRSVSLTTSSTISGSDRDSNDQGHDAGCTEAFAFCLSNAERLYDYGYVAESHILYLACGEHTEVCRDQSAFAQQGPNRIGFSVFPPLWRGTNGGVVVHRSGMPSVFTPPIKDPLGHLGPKPRR